MGRNETVLRAVERRFLGGARHRKEEASIVVAEPHDPVTGRTDSISSWGATTAACDSTTRRPVAGPGVVSAGRSCGGGSKEIT